MTKTLKEEYLGKDGGGLGYFQMGGGIKKKSLYNKKNGKPSRDPGVAAVRKINEQTKPVAQDLEDAVDFLRFEVDNFKLNLSDFDLKYLGKLSVGELYQYDDIDSWLETFEDEEEFSNFRQKSFFQRTKEWGNNPPPIIIVNVPGHYTAIGDGRGRVNYANFKKIPLDVYMLTLTKPLKENKESDDDIVTYLKKRNIDFDKTKVITDLETNQATFLLFNLSGQLIGYQKYNPKGSKDYRNTELGKYFTHVTKNP